MPITTRKSKLLMFINSDLEGNKYKNLMPLHHSFILCNFPLLFSTNLGLIFLLKQVFNSSTR